jgi:hypothetical protein
MPQAAGGVSVTAKSVGKRLLIFLVVLAALVGVTVWAFQHLGRWLVVHTRRSRAIWRAEVGNHPHAIVRHDASEPGDPLQWWRATTDVQDVVHEILGLINSYMGFVVKPARAGCPWHVTAFSPTPPISNSSAGS